ncbi:IS3 family transposase [Flavimobilis sp. GY10621]|uniref:IS3 family transposase n=1 Tax=Flavimobilis rhizosphaerae TaxID=2775421 RepID=A0ABR9DRG1_9MICO|nr:IS3 family transposase [Flavimobilis rhizosphaerae]
MQVEPLNRRCWRTRLELANAIFEYLEILYNRLRQHSTIGWLTPVEFENAAAITVAWVPVFRTHRSRDTPRASTTPGAVHLLVMRGAPHPNRTYGGTTRARMAEARSPTCDRTRGLGVRARRPDRGS